MSKYVPINPNDFMVQDAILHLNNNIDYLYNMKSTNLVNGKVNLIPYADFTILSNIDYWLPYLSSKIAIKDYNLYAYTSEKIVGVRTPCLIKELEPGQTYSLVLRARSNIPESIFNELHIQKSDNSLIRINYDKEITPNFNTHYIYFTVEDSYGTVRLVLGSGDTRENDKLTFIPEEKEENPFINSEGAFSSSYDVVKDSYSKGDSFKEALYYMLLTRDLTPLNYIMSFFKDNEIPSNDKGAKDSLLETFLLNKLKVQLEIEGVSRFQDAHIPIFDHLGELYNNSKQVGLFPVMKDSTDYSLLLSLYALDIIDIWVSAKDNYIGADYDLLTIKANILQFVEDNYHRIYGSGLIKGGVRFDEERFTYNYLDDKNNYSIDTISLFNQVELLRLFIKAGKLTDIETICNKILGYKQNDMDCVIPKVIKTNGIPLAGTEISITIPAMIIDIVKSAPDAFKDPSGYKESLITSINVLKSPNGLYKYDYTLDNEVYSSNNYLETYFKEESYILPRDLYFNSVALYEGVVTEDDVLINQGNVISDLYNKIETTIKRADLTINEDSIIAIVGKQFTTKEYVGGQLSAINTRLNQAELALRPESIIATVTNSNEWINVKDTIDANQVTLLNKLEETNAQVTINSDAISNKVWTKDIQEATNYVVKIGHNLIRNSNFMIPGYRNWEPSSEAYLSVFQSGDGKVWLKCTDSEVTTLTHQCVAYLPEGRCNISFELYGSGVFGIKVMDRSENILAEGFIEGKVSSQRYNISFDNNNKHCLPIIEISFIGALNLQVTNLKLCVGDSDFGWSINSDDFLYITDDLENICECFTGVDLSDKLGLMMALEDFRKRVDFLSYLFYEWSNHKGLDNTDIKKDFINIYNQFIRSAENVYQQYYNQFSTDKSTNIDEAKNELREILLSYIPCLSKVIQQIALQEADTGSSSLKDLIDKEIQWIISSVQDIAQLVSTSLTDSALSPVERDSIDRDLDILQEDLLSITDMVDYYNSEISGNVLLLTEMNDAYQDYMGAINNFFTQANKILEYERVTTDMGYVLNGYAEDIILLSTPMNNALTTVVDNYQDTRVTVALLEVRDKAEDVINIANAINDLITSITEDEVILSLEKDNMSRLLEQLNNAKLLINVDVDYYITNPYISKSQEVSNLKSALSLFNSNYNNMVSTGMEVVNNSMVSDVNFEPWNKAHKELETVLDNLISRTKCAIQVLILSNSAHNIDLGAVYIVEDALALLLNASKEFFEDNLTTYPEIASQSEFLSILEDKSTTLVDALWEYTLNPLLEETEEKINLEHRLGDYEIAYTTFYENILLLISDLQVPREELLKYSLDVYEYKVALSNLQVMLVNAINKVASLTFTSISGDSINDYIDDKVDEVQDALDDVVDLSNEILLDNIINTSERQSLRAVKDILTKEHLDVLKQVDVYLDAILTPELVGQEILIDLNNCRTDLDVAYDILDKELTNILNMTVVSPIDKTNYNNALNSYQEELEKTRELLKDAAALISKLDLEGFKSGEFSSLVTRVTNAELRITDESITSIVESNTTTLVKQQTFNEFNETITREFESIRDITSSHTVDLEGITSRVTNAELDINSINGNITDITTRVNAAEQKITPEAITSVVSSTFATREQLTNLSNSVQTNFAQKSEVQQASNSILSTVSSTYATQAQVNALNDTVWLNYAQKSEVQQTAQEIKFSFLSSGGYNKLRNSAFKNGTANWNYLSWNGFAGNNGVAYGGMNVIGAGTSEWGLHNRNVLQIYANDLRVANGDLLGVGVASDPIWGGVNWTFSCLLSSHRTNQIYLEVIEFDSNGNRMPLQNTLVLNGDKNGWNSNRENWHKVNWKFDLKNSGCANFVINIWMGAWNGEQISAFLWVAEPMLVLGHYDELLYTENSEELYSGITTIDRDGIKVTSSATNGYTHMTSQGFFINHNGSDIFRVDSSGLYLNGSGYFTGTISATNIFGGYINGATIEGNTIKGGTVDGTSITGGSININNNFIVNSAGSVTTNSTINAQGGLYTRQDIRGYDPTGVSGGLTLVTGTGHLAVRTEDPAYNVYLQSAGGEVKVTAPGDPNTFSNLRAWSLLANNAVYANGIMLTSDINKKKNIEDYTESALHEICTTPIRTYHLEGDLDEELKRIGIIMQEAPLNAIDISGHGVDLYQMVAMSWKAIQELKLENERLTQLIQILENK